VTATSPGGTEATSTGTGVSTGWQRLHPLSPVLRGGRLLALAVLVVVRQSVETLHVDNGRDAVPYLLGVPVVAVLAVVQWRTTRWRVEDGDFRLETGVLRRRSRRVPLARLQAVDLVRPPLARLTGLAELRLQAVGHDGAEAGLAYLSLPEAHRVRAVLLHLAGRGTITPAEPGTATAAAQPPPGVLLARVPPGVLAASVALSGPAATFLLLAVGLVVLGVSGPPGSGPALLGGVFPVLLSAGAVLQRGFAREYGFRLTEADGALGITHGLLETRVQTVPLDRVQAVVIEEPALWRVLPATRDWVRMRVVVAGYRGESRRQEARTDVLLPVGPRWLAGTLVARLLPGVTVDPCPGPAPRRARWLHPLQAGRLGLGVDDRVVTITGGWPGRSIDLLPHAKVQSWRRTQGPLGRRLRLVTLHVDVAGRPRSAIAHARDSDSSGPLLERLADLGRAARARG